MSRGVVIGGSGHIGAISRRGWFPRDFEIASVSRGQGSPYQPPDAWKFAHGHSVPRSPQIYTQRAPESAGTEHLGCRTVRNDAAACHDEPIAASFLNSQDAPRPRDRISERYLLRTIATVNHRDAIPDILDAIVSEQGPRVLGSGCFIRGGRFPPRHKRRLVRRGRREEIDRSCAREGGSLLQLVEPCRETSNF